MEFKNKDFEKAFIEDFNRTYTTKITLDDILKKLDEIEANKKEAIIQGREIAEYLWVEELPIEYEEFVNDSSRLELKPRARIVVGERVKAEWYQMLIDEYNVNTIIGHRCNA